MQEISNDIIIQAAEGNIAAFEMIYKATSSFVYNVALRITYNKEDAQEVTQEVFLIMHSKLKQFRGESSLKTWVYRIAVNCAINFARKTKGQKNSSVEYEDHLAPRVEADVHKQIEKEHHHTAVDKILSSLNEEHRTCVILRNIEGLSYQQIAETLQININTVRSRLKRAREKILTTRKQADYEYL